MRYEVPAPWNRIVISLGWGMSNEWTVNRLVPSLVGTSPDLSVWVQFANDKIVLCHAECNEASIYSSADSSNRFLPLVGMTEAFNQSFSTSVPERSRRVNFQLFMGCVILNVMKDPFNYFANRSYWFDHTSAPLSDRISTPLNDRILIAVESHR